MDTQTIASHPAKDKTNYILVNVECEIWTLLNITKGKTNSIAESKKDTQEERLTTNINKQKDHNRTP
jgi:hypothetical protein